MLTKEIVRDAANSAKIEASKTEDEFRAWQAFQIRLLHGKVDLLHDKIDALLPNGEFPDTIPYNGMVHK